MWKALDQQNVFAGTQVVTGLAERATWAALGDQATKIHFLSHYVYTAPKNKVNNWLVAQLRKRGQVPDIFTPDGFVEAQMLVHALQKGDYDVDKMISAARGLQVPRSEGLPGDPAAGPRDAAADVPGRAGEEERPSRRQRARHRVAVRHRAADRGDEGLRTEGIISA